MSIQDTLKKVEKALNLRFEKDSSFYISKEDTEKIKEALSNSNFQNIQALITRLGSKVVVIVILKNSWLISFNSQNQRYLENIFNDIDKSFLGEAAKDIVKDNIFSTSEFKTFIEGYYLYNIELQKCRKIYKNKHEKIENRIICFERYLKEDYILNHSTAKSIIYINQEFESDPTIYNYLQNKKNSFLVSIFQESQEKDIIANWIIVNKLVDRKDIIWQKLFLSLNNIAFNKTVKYISSNPTWDNNITKYLIQIILKNFSQMTNFEDDIAKLYKKNNSIRLLFIRLLEPAKFKNQNLAHSILDRFDNIGFPNDSKKDVRNIRNWKDSKGHTGFISVQKIIISLEGNHNFSSKSLLNYYSRQLEQTDKKVILQLYKHKKNKNEVKLIISYYLTTFFYKRDIPTYFKNINAKSYIEQIANYIESEMINTTFAKQFLEDNNKHELVAKLNRR